MILKVCIFILKYCMCILVDTAEVYFMLNSLSAAGAVKSTLCCMLVCMEYNRIVMLMLNCML